MNMRRYKKCTYRREYGKVEMRAILQSRTGFFFYDYRLLDNRSVIIVLITLIVLLTFHKLILSVCQH